MTENIVASGNDGISNSMFLHGIELRKLDSDGRIILSSRFVKPLGTSLGLAPNLDFCIVIYPGNELERFIHDLERLYAGEVEDRVSTKHVLEMAKAHKHTTNLDARNRLTIPRALREYAGMGKEIVILGMQDHLEVFSRERWDAMSEKAAGDYAENTVAHLDEGKTG